LENQTDMKTMKIDCARPSCWQRVFSQSKVNGAPYGGEQLPNLSWEWPKDTYLQRRLKRLACNATEPERFNGAGASDS
jgi:hypothetical protein